MKDDVIGGSRRRHGRDEKCVQNFVRRRPIGRHRRRWEDDIRMDPREIGSEGVH